MTDKKENVKTPGLQAPEFFFILRLCGKIPFVKELKIASEQETRLFALDLAEKLDKGSLIALSGDLGTGKTALTKYIAEGLGVTETVTSPTFTIIQEYRSGRLPLYHFDVYRVNDEDELFELGYEEYFYGDGVCVVEWADLIEDLIPEDALRIHIEYGAAPEERIYKCSF